MNSHNGIFFPQELVGLEQEEFTETTPEWIVDLLRVRKTLKEFRDINEAKMGDEEEGLVLATITLLNSNIYDIVAKHYDLAYRTNEGSFRMLDSSSAMLMYAIDLSDIIHRVFGTKESNNFSRLILKTLKIPAGSVQNLCSFKKD